MSDSLTDKEILDLWRNPNFSGSYRGIKTFQILLKTDLGVYVPQNRLYKILKNDSIYLIHAKPKRNFERRKFDLNFYGELIQSDIGFMFEYDHFKYFLVVIDCYSKKIIAKAIKDKTSLVVLNAFKDILKELNCKIYKLETDQGSEFALIKKYCKEKNIVFKYKFGKNKARSTNFTVRRLTM